MDISHLPKAMQRDPKVRALSLKVYPGDNPRHFRVPGSTAIYDVHYFAETYHCSCQAARNNALCAHAIAAQRYHEEHL